MRWRLILNDPNARVEYDAYKKLVREHREIANRLTAIATEMAEYRDLPMGRHDEKKLSEPKVFQAFERYTHLEEDLLSLLRKRVEQDQKMLASIHNG